jgi:hypothetical protein
MLLNPLPSACQKMLLKANNYTDFNPVESERFNCSFYLMECAAEINKFSCAFHLAESITFCMRQVQPKTIDSATVRVFPNV